MKNFISNVDTIYCLVYFENYDNNIDVQNTLNYLKKEKEKALLAVTNNALYKHMITISEMSFQLFPNGSRGYSYIIRNNGYEIKIAQFSSKLKTFAPICVRISSEYLWAQGLKNSWNILQNWIVETFDNIKEVKISRVDLATHISDIDFITNFDKVYKGKYKKSHNFYTGKEINSLCFGSRNSDVFCRIYNKTQEINELRHKYWFIDIWKKHNMNVDNVWNVEFEIKSNLLRMFNINSINDLLEHITALWHYCTTDWLVKVDRTNSRIERCNTCSDWIIVQNSYNGFSSKELIKRDKQILTDANALIPTICGYLTSYGAMIHETNFKKILDIILLECQKYYSKKSTCADNVIMSKIPKFLDCEVHKYE